MVGPQKGRFAAHADNKYDYGLRSACGGDYLTWRFRAQIMSEKAAWPECLGCASSEEESTWTISTGLDVVKCSLTRNSRRTSGEVLKFRILKVARSV
jgi:hypothetical protein